MSRKATHARRLRHAKEVGEKFFTSWALAHNLQLEIKNNWNHWLIRRKDDGALVAEWWPASGRLVFEKRWDKALHVPDYQQLQFHLKERLGL